MSVHKQDVLDLLNSLKAVRDSFAVVRVRHIAETSTVARRLFIEGAVNYMSPEEMAQASGYTPKAVRMYLREHGLDPRMKKPMLSKHAARVLADNAALLNLEPADLLLSPLAYLPAGDELRREVQEKNVSKVTEVEAEPVATGMWCTNCGFLEDPAECPEDRAQCTGCGCAPADHLYVKVTVEV